MGSIERRSIVTGRAADLLEGFEAPHLLLSQGILVAPRIAVVRAVWNLADTLHDVAVAGHAHLGLGQQGAAGLILEAVGAPIPELTGIIGGIPDRGRVARADAAVYAHGCGPAVIAAFHDVVTGVAGNRAGLGQARIEIQFLAQFHFGLGGGIMVRERRLFR